jgi:hypothetical protein
MLKSGENVKKNWQNAAHFQFRLNATMSGGNEVLGSGSVNDLSLVLVCATPAVPFAAARVDDRRGGILFSGAVLQNWFEAEQVQG